ncbi:hypothetical protein FG93_01081 [Bosea sp. LC85]|nr:hypothetical protein FG93_01081 [Bosea sp. LC85]
MQRHDQRGLGGWNEAVCLCWAAGLLAAVVGSRLGYEYVCGRGRNDLIKIARKGARCARHPLKATGASAEKIDWCLGVAVISETRLRRGEWLKSIAVEGMNYPCIGLFDEKPQG